MGEREAPSHGPMTVPSQGGSQAREAAKPEVPVQSVVQVIERGLCLRPASVTSACANLDEAPLRPLASPNMRQDDPLGWTPGS